MGKPRTQASGKHSQVLKGTVSHFLKLAARKFQCATIGTGLAIIRLSLPMHLYVQV